MNMYRKNNFASAQVYYSIFVYNEGRLVFIDDHQRRPDAVRACVEWQEDGFVTEMFELSNAPIFDTSPDDHTRDVERYAY